jgi:hypothetical protein
MQQDRTDWLMTYINFAEGDGKLDSEQTIAGNAVDREVRDSYAQRANIVADFLLDQTIDLAIDYGFPTR